MEIVGLSLPFQRGNLIHLQSDLPNNGHTVQHSSCFQWFANICTKLSRARFRKTLAHCLSAKTRADPPLAAQLYVSTPQRHSSTFKAPSHVKTTLGKKKTKKHPTDSRRSPFPPSPVQRCQAFGVAPNGGTAPSVTGLSQFLLEDYQLSAADSSTGGPALDASAPARRSTARHN